MSAKIYDTTSQAFVDAETPKVNSGGVFTDAEGKVYSGGAWEDAWSQKYPDVLWIYNNGNECLSGIAGGLNEVNTYINGTQRGIVRHDSDKIYMQASGNSNIVTTTANAIDLSQYNYVELTYSYSPVGAYQLWLLFPTNRVNVSDVYTTATNYHLTYPSASNQKEIKSIPAVCKDQPRYISIYPDGYSGTSATIFSLRLTKDYPS